MMPRFLSFPSKECENIEFHVKYIRFLPVHLAHKVLSLFFEKIKE